MDRVTAWPGCMPSSSRCQRGVPPGEFARAHSVYPDLEKTRVVSPVGLKNTHAQGGSDTRIGCAKNADFLFGRTSGLLHPILLSCRKITLSAMDHIAGPNQPPITTGLMSNARLKTALTSGPSCLPPNWPDRHQPCSKTSGKWGPDPEGRLQADAYCISR
jgi:hypothetical protein